MRRNGPPHACPLPSQAGGEGRFLGGGRDAVRRDDPLHRLFDVAEALAKALEERHLEAWRAKFAGDYGS